MTVAPRSPVLSGLRAVTFDFGNTLVPVDRAGLRRVVEETAERVSARCGIDDVAGFLAVWAEERERQFREEVPAFREVDLAQRFGRVLARVRAMAPPAADERWDDEDALRRSTPEERAFAIEAYSRAFVAGIPPPASVAPLLERLAQRGLRLGILSNWPLAETIDRYAEAAGWTPYLTAIVVSQRVGTIKPDPAIFAVAARLLDVPGSSILHVGDDWSADVAGAKRAGWRAAHLGGRPDDSPLPIGDADGAEADVELARLEDIEHVLEPG